MDQTNLTTKLSLAYWHRNTKGILQRGELTRSTGCNNKMKVFVPEPSSFQQYPSILIVCIGPHTHPPPQPTKTPPVYIDIFASLIRNLQWQMADITPRRLLIDTGFMYGLRQTLQWDSELDEPLLIDLHPSFLNQDHVRYLIERIRKIHFSEGTGWECACKSCPSVTDC